MSPDLDDEFIARIVYPLTRPGAQIKALRRMGFHVLVKPNGRPLVSRANYEAVTNPAAQTPAASSGAGASPQPNSAALIDLFSRKKVSYANGTQAPKQSARST